MSLLVDECEAAKACGYSYVTFALCGIKDGIVHGTCHVFVDGARQTPFDGFKFALGEYDGYNVPIPVNIDAVHKR